MSKKLHPNDIPVLAKIFNPDSTLIWVFLAKKDYAHYRAIPDKLDSTLHLFSHFFDLQKAWKDKTNAAAITLINLSNQKIDWQLFIPKNDLVILDFNSPLSHSKWQFDCINNPNGTIRWIYPSLLKKTIFLNLYNGSGWKGKIIEQGFKLGFKVGLKGWLKSNSFQVIAQKLFLDNINKSLNQSNYAIFTGTVGINRKAVISFEENGRATQFMKLPLTQSAHQLVKQEHKWLKGLASYQFHHLGVPKAKKIDKGLMLTNIKPQVPLSNNCLTPKHLLALQELYQQTSIPMILSSTKVWTSIQQDIASLKENIIVNNLSKTKVHQIHELLSKLIQTFNPSDLYPMSIAHGDLTPWNSYLSAQKLQVYDWELAEQLPLLYDAFHFIFQTSILVNKLPFKAIKTQIDQLSHSPIVQAILTQYHLDFQHAYRFYLLRNTSYYLSRYIQQEQLHIQAHWLVETWSEALKQLPTIKEVVKIKGESP